MANGVVAAVITEFDKSALLPMQLMYLEMTMITIPSGNANWLVIQVYESRLWCNKGRVASEPTATNSKQ